jgi:hypothetical protein
LGLTVVIEDDLFPTLVGMTGFTSLSESAFVGIVLLMTGVAVGRSRTISLVAVTVFATREDMSPSQTEFRLVMIEPVEVHPFLFRVAGLARLSESALMHVLLLVAGVAIDRCRFIVLIGMAVFALRVDMLASEWELGLVMVERGSIFPIFFCMAGLTRST